MERAVVLGFVQSGDRGSYIIPCQERETWRRPSCRCSRAAAASCHPSRFPCRPPFFPPPNRPGPQERRLRVLPARAVPEGQQVQVLPRPLHRAQGPQGRPLRRQARRRGGGGGHGGVEPGAAGGGHRAEARHRGPPPHQHVASSSWTRWRRSSTGGELQYSARTVPPAGRCLPGASQSTVVQRAGAADPLLRSA